MKLFLLFVLSFISPVLILNPLNERKSKITFGDFVFYFIISVILFFAWVFILSFFHVSIDKTEQNRLLIGTFSGYLLTLALTNFNVWAFLLPAIKKTAEIGLNVTKDYIFPFIKLIALSIVRFVIFAFDAITKKKNNKNESETKNVIAKEIPQAAKESEAPIQPITKKERDIQNILDKLDRF